MSTKQLLTKQTHGATPLLKVDESKGEATVAFAQLEVVDHDNDYTMKGAFTIGEKVKVCQTGHAHGLRVAGAGEILGEKEYDGKLWAVAKIKFFLNTEAGREEYETAKALAAEGHTQEWSYGYDILEASPGQIDGKGVQLLKQQHVYEISPVLRGAGISTHTVDIKTLDDASCKACGQEIKAEEAPAPSEETPTGDACTGCGKQLDDCKCSDPNAPKLLSAATVQIPFELARAKALGVSFD